MDDGLRLVSSAEDRMLVQLHVRAIASEISDYACRHTQGVLGDATMARPLMASATAVVSRFLMIYRIPLCRGTTKTLLRTCFRRALQRDAAKLDQREFYAGSNDVEEAMLAFVNSGRSSGYIDSGHIVRLLSQRSLQILGLRDLGYTWKEIGRFLSMSECATKRMFHAELQQAMEIADHPQFRQAEVEVAKRRRLDRQQGPRVAPFTSPLCD